jgi:hypothetical protein
MLRNFNILSEIGYSLDLLQQCSISPILGPEPDGGLSRGRGKTHEDGDKR